MSVGGWNNPPPPGTEVAQEDEDEEHSSTSSKTKAEDHKIRSIDRIDPYLKNPEYVEYEKRTHSRDRSRHRHSKSEKERKSRDVDKQRSRYHRSRSRSKRHHRYRSYSRSTSRTRHSKSKREKRHRGSSSRTRRSYSRSRSRSRTRRGHRRSRARHSRGRDELRSGSEEKEELNTSGEVDDDDEPLAKENAFKNDGSFLEMFKKMQEEKAAEAAKEEASGSEIKKPLPAFGKRRGGRVLKTGLVEKMKVAEETGQTDGLDAWSVYMKEVKRYKEACCDDDSKTRPLVK